MKLKRSNTPPLSNFFVTWLVCLQFIGLIEGLENTTISNSPWRTTSENAELGEGEREGGEQGGRDGGIVKVRSEHDRLAPWRSGDCTRALPSRLEREKLTEDPKNNPARCITSCKEEGFQFADFMVNTQG